MYNYSLPKEFSRSPKCQRPSKSRIGMGKAIECVKYHNYNLFVPSTSRLKREANQWSKDVLND